jgi:chromosome segregation ATPase
LLLLQAEEYESTLANITELEEALALAQEQVDATTRLAEVEETRDRLQRQLDEAARKLAQSAADLEETRNSAKQLEGKLQVGFRKGGLGFSGGWLEGKLEVGFRRGGLGFSGF